METACKKVGIHTLSLIVMVQWKPRHWKTTLDTKIVIFHFHDCWRKSKRIHLELWKVQLSSDENPPVTFHYTGWLIGILILAYYNPYITG